MLTITPATHSTRSLKLFACILRGSNSRGLSPLGLKSSALTTRPRMRLMLGLDGECRLDGKKQEATTHQTEQTKGGGRGQTHTKKNKNTSTNQKMVEAPRVRLELTTYRLTAGRAADCAIQERCIHFGHPLELMCPGRQFRFQLVWVGALMCVAEVPDDPYVFVA